MKKFAIALGALGLFVGAGLTEASAGSRVVIDQSAAATPPPPPRTATATSPASGRRASATRCSPSRTATATRIDRRPAGQVQLRLQLPARKEQPDRRRPDGQEQPGGHHPEGPQQRRRDDPDRQRPRGRDQPARQRQHGRGDPGQLIAPRPPPRGRAHRAPARPRSRSEWRHPMARLRYLLPALLVPAAVGTAFAAAAPEPRSRPLPRRWPARSGSATRRSAARSCRWRGRRCRSPGDYDVHRLEDLDGRVPPSRPRAAISTRCPAWRWCSAPRCSTARDRSRRNSRFAGPEASSPASAASRRRDPPDQCLAALAASGRGVAGSAARCL